MYGECNVKDGIAGQDEAQDPLHISPLVLLWDTTIVIGNQVILDNMSGLGSVGVGEGSYWIW